MRDLTQENDAHDGTIPATPAPRTLAFSAEQSQKESIIIARNRTNSLKSTGPRSVEGRARVRFNARKHGLLCREAVVFTDLERQEDLERLRKAFWNALRPCTDIEGFLLDRLVSLAWRLRRAAHVESGIFRWLYEPNAERSSRDGIAGAFLRDGMQQPFKWLNKQHAGTDSLGRLGRYEARIERAFFRALRELERAQAARLGVPQGARPLAFNVNVGGNSAAAPLQTVSVRVPAERVPGAPEGDPEA